MSDIPTHTETKPMSCLPETKRLTKKGRVSLVTQFCEVSTCPSV